MISRFSPERCPGCTAQVVVTVHDDVATLVRHDTLMDDGMRGEPCPASGAVVGLESIRDRETGR